MLNQGLRDLLVKGVELIENDLKPQSYRGGYTDDELFEGLFSMFAALQKRVDNLFIHNLQLIKKIEKLENDKKPV